MDAIARLGHFARQAIAWIGHQRRPGIRAIGDAPTLGDRGEDQFGGPLGAVIVPGQHAPAAQVGGQPTLLHGPFVSPADEVTPLPVYGAGAGLYPEALRVVPDWETATPSAVGVGQVAELALRRGRGLVPAEPLYLRESDAKVHGPRKRAGA